MPLRAWTSLGAEEKFGNDDISVVTTGRIYYERKHTTWGYYDATRNFNLTKRAKFLRAYAHCGAWNNPHRIGVYKKTDGIENAELLAVTPNFNVPAGYAWNGAGFIGEPVISPANLAMTLHAKADGYYYTSYHNRSLSGCESKREVPDAFDDGLSNPHGTDTEPVQITSCYCIYAIIRKLKLSWGYPRTK